MCPVPTIAYRPLTVATAMYMYCIFAAVLSFCTFIVGLVCPDASLPLLRNHSEGIHKETVLWHIIWHAYHRL